MDLRIPVAILFLVLGVLLAGYGLVAHDRPEVDLGFHVNVIWGVVMSVFGLLMLVSARLTRRK
ncbi:MAG: hypothetical protein HY236_17560 [Acidobacteria bacterium]|nr:hypothetical protein [Acidobacteriota bacterium]